MKFRHNEKNNCVTDTTSKNEKGKNRDTRILLDSVLYKSYIKHSLKNPKGLQIELTLQGLIILSNTGCTTSYITSYCFRKMLVFLVFQVVFLTIIFTFTQEVNWPTKFFVCWECMQEQCFTWSFSLNLTSITRTIKEY